jgi:hypothetical protein
LKHDISCHYNPFLRTNFTGPAFFAAGKPVIPRPDDKNIAVRTTEWELLFFVG